MRKFTFPASVVGLIVFGLLFSSVAAATAITMNFDQLNGAGEYVDNYYNGGCGSASGSNTVTCGGPNYGVVWSGFLAGATWPTAGARYNSTSISLPPSGTNVVFTGSEVNGAPDLMNVAGGFTGALYFTYDSSYTLTTITLYSGMNGTGTALNSRSFSQSGTYCDFGKYYSCWSSFVVPFPRTALSVVFSGSGSGYLGLDDVSINTSSVGVPEPAALGMFGLGLLLIGTFMGLRRRGGAAARHAA